MVDHRGTRKVEQRAMWQAYLVCARTCELWDNGNDRDEDIGGGEVDWRLPRTFSSGSIRTMMEMSVSEADGSKQKK